MVLYGSRMVLNASVFDGRCLCRSQCVDHLDLLGMVVLGFVRF